MNSRSMILAAITALSHGYEPENKAVPVKPKARNERTPEQVEELKRLAQEKRERKAAKLRGARQ